MGVSKTDAVKIIFDLIDRNVSQNSEESGRSNFSESPPPQEDAGIILFGFK
jgi:hypothetical protein